MTAHEFGNEQKVGEVAMYSTSSLLEGLEEIGGLWQLCGRGNLHSGVVHLS